MYLDQIDKYGDMFTVAEYLAAVADGLLNDYDGHGLACRGGKASRRVIIPSEPARIPSDATHIVWYNK